MSDLKLPVFPYRQNQSGQSFPKEIFLGGVGGRIKGYLHKVKVEIAGKVLTIPVVFSHEYLVSFNLLGRDTFFENFLITFDEKSKKVKLE